MWYVVFKYQPYLIGVYVSYAVRDDCKLSKMIGQKLSIAILSLNLIGHTQIAMRDNV